MHDLDRQQLEQSERDGLAGLLELEQPESYATSTARPAMRRLPPGRTARVPAAAAGSVVARTSSCSARSEMSTDTGSPPAARAAGSPVNPAATDAPDTKEDPMSSIPPIPPPADEEPRQDLAQPTRVTLTRTESEQTDDQRLWAVIKDRSEAITFENYKRFIDQVEVDGQLFRGVEGYQTLKTATRAWLQHEAGVWLSPSVERVDTSGKLGPARRSPIRSSRSSGPRSTAIFPRSPPTSDATSGCCGTTTSRSSRTTSRCCPTTSSSSTRSARCR